MTRSTLSEFTKYNVDTDTSKIIDNNPTVIRPLRRCCNDEDIIIFSQEIGAKMNLVQIGQANREKGLDLNLRSLESIDFVILRRGNDCLVAWFADHFCQDRYWVLILVVTKQASE